MDYDSFRRAMRKHGEDKISVQRTLKENESRINKAYKSGKESVCIDMYDYDDAPDSYDALTKAISIKNWVDLDETQFGPPILVKCFKFK